MADAVRFGEEVQKNRTRHCELQKIIGRNQVGRSRHWLQSSSPALPIIHAHATHFLGSNVLAGPAPPLPPFPPPPWHLPPLGGGARGGAVDLETGDVLPAWGLSRFL